MDTDDAVAVHKGGSVWKCVVGHRVGICSII